MSSTLIRGKYIISRVNDDGTIQIITDGAVFQRNGGIIEVGDFHRLKGKYAYDESIGSEHHIILPGFVNAHHHGRGLTYLQRGVRDDCLELWFIKLIGRAAPDTYLDNLLCLSRMIESGITTAVHSQATRYPGYGEEAAAILKAYANAGVRVAFALGIKNQNYLVSEEESFIASLPPGLAKRCRDYLEPLKRFSTDDYFSTFSRLHREYDRPNSPVKVLFGPTGPQFCTDEILVQIKQAATRQRAAIHTHLLESPYQQSYALRRFGKTWVEHLSEIGFLGKDLSCAHCVRVTPGDLDVLAGSGVSVCHNLSANLRLRNGVAPLNAMLERKMNVALGTDNVSLNDDEDMLQEMRLCASIHRKPGMGEEQPGPGQLLKMATINGARVGGFGDEIGILEAGKRADIVLVDLHDIVEPYMDSELDILDALLGRGKKSDIDTVMIDGEIVYRNKKHVRIDREKLLADLREGLASAFGDPGLRKLANDIYPYARSFYRKAPAAGPLEGATPYPDSIS